MVGAHRMARRHLSLVGISILGALASNGVQLTLSQAMVFGDNVKLIAPPFIAIGTVSALVLGGFAEGFSEKSRWLNSVRGLK